MKALDIFLIIKSYPAKRKQSTNMDLKVFFPAIQDKRGDGFSSIPFL